MYLKNLELFGFKSFAKRTKIDFNEGITGVVGPNGSGKSNIIDAIMWALGETSAKQLRGARMEDVIFSGTSIKKPLGFAEVILTFDNKDNYLEIPYKELSIRRKMYRSGESEFYINKQKVRLKDIRELFMDTGIGKDGYSFIGQGQIEQILSTKPQDRRAVFEEAAGISKYKSRKDESEKALGKTLDNIQRLDDILKEIILQEKRLKEERDIASLALEKRKEKDFLYSHFLLEKEIDLDKQREKLLGDLENVKNELLSANALKNEIDIRKKEIRQELGVLEIETEKKQEEKVDHIRSLESFKGQLESNYVLKEESTTRLEEINNKIFQNKEEIKKIEEDIFSLKQSLKKEKDEYLEVKNRLEKEQEILSELRNKVAENRDLKLTLDKEEKTWIERSSSIHSKIDSLEFILKEKASRKNSLEQQLATLKEQYEDILLEREDKIRLIRQGSDSLANIEKQIENIELFIKEVIVNRDSAKKRFEELGLENEKIIRERDFIKRVHENHEGYSFSVRKFLNFVYKNTAIAEDVIGPVADNLTVDKGYELAISLALGAGAQNIIIKNDKNVGKMIDLLKKNNIGRLTFYPLNTMEYRNVDQGIYKRSKVDFEVALDKISYEKELEPIFSNLLGRILIVKSIEDGKQLSRDLNRRYKIVTKDGELFQIGGSISGGSVRNNQVDLYNRQAEIENKDLRIKEMASLLEESEKKLIEQNGIYEEKSKELIKLSTEKNNFNKKIMRNENILENIKQAQISLEKRMTDIGEEIKTEELIITDNRETLSQLYREEELLGSQQDSREKKYKLENFEELENRSKVQEEIVTDTRISLNKIESSIREYEIIESQKNSKYTELNHSIKDLEEEAKQVEFNLQSRSDKSDEFTEKIQALNEKVSVCIKKTQELSEKKNFFEKKWEEIESKEKDSYEQLSILERKEEKSLVRLDDLNEQSIEFKNEINSFFIDHEKPTEKINLPIKEIEKRYKRLEKETLNLGPINENALKEYEEIKERLDFVKHQKEDLVLSKDKLESVIKQLEREMRKLFKSSIAEIQIYFNEIFIQLFNGGKAQVELEEGQDLLEAGIEIQVQPPGKKLQSLTLLSGGERSLTAVALLFALLKRKVSPFCILDEIDAALDEANIKRYTNYLNTMGELQFIMVTHRKTTMEIANCLYGITMQEEGVSSVLSMELEEAKEHVGMDKKEI